MIKIPEIKRGVAIVEIKTSQEIELNKYNHLKEKAKQANLDLEMFFTNCRQTQEMIEQLKKKMK